MPHIPTAIEKRKIERGERWGIPENDEVPNGSLVLKSSFPPGLGLRSQWGDGKKQRIEDCLSRFVVELVTAADAIKRAREEAERRARERREEQLRWEERERRKAEEKARIEKLDKQMSSWSRASRARAYADAIEQKMLKGGGKTGPDSETRKWITSIRRYADRIDPLSASDDGEDD